MKTNVTVGKARRLVSCALLSLLAYAPLHAASLPKTAMAKPGESAEQAAQMATIYARIDALKTAWRAEGKPAGVEMPKLLSGTILSQTLTVGQPGAVPSLQFAYKTGTAGLAVVFFIFTSPAGNVYFVAPYEQGPRSTHGTVKFDAATFYPPPFSQPGNWTLTQATIVDQSGNDKVYDKKELAAIFPQQTITIVNNGAIDYTPPVAVTGQILTPTVSLSSPLPQFVATVSATDDVSGVALVYVFIEPPNGFGGQASYQTIPFPATSGNFTAYSDIFSGQPTGTWTITGYELCDLAFNCVMDSNATDVKALLGATTFTVTN